MEKSNIDYLEMDQIVKVPTLISAFSCGTGTPFDDGHVYEEVPSSCVRNKNCYMLFISGDSMEPTFSPGDRCFVDVSATPKSGSVVAVVVDGEYLVKRYIRKGFSTFLTSDNARYNDIKIDDDGHSIILGVVYYVLKIV